MKSIYFFITVFLSNFGLGAQNWTWAYSSEMLTGICIQPIDNNGLIVATSGSTSYKGNNVPGGCGAALAYQEKSGRVKWLAGMCATQPTDLALDDSNNVYIVGHIEPNAKVYSSSGFDFSFNMHKNRDGFLYKFDPLGNIKWVKQIGDSTSDDEIVAVVSDKKGNIFIAGVMKKSLPYSASTENNFVSKYNQNDVLLWSVSSNWKGQFALNDMCLSSDGGVLLSALALSDTLQFAGYSVDLTNNPAIVIKMKTDGTCEYVQSIGSNALSYHIKALKNNGFALTGLYSQTSTLPGISWQVNKTGQYIVAFDSIGKTRWAHTIEGAYGDCSSNRSDDVVYAFSFSKSALVMPNHITLPGDKYSDAGVIKFDRAGNIIATTLTKGNLDEGLTRVNDVHFGVNDAIFITGDFNGETVFENTILNEQSTNSGNTRQYIASIDDKFSTGLKKEDPAAFEFYPSPIEKVLHMSFPKPTSSTLLVTITNVDGVKLTQTSIEAPSIQQDIDVSMLVAGVYFLSVQANNFQKVMKLIKD